MWRNVVHQTTAPYKVGGHHQEGGASTATLDNNVSKNVMDDEQHLDAARRDALARFTETRGLPEQFSRVFLQWYAGVTAALAKRTGASESPLLVGLSGCQGSGKSILVDAMARVLEEAHRVTTTVLSLDDFYLTRVERESLAQRLHPLFATRGVPGTHDIGLLRHTMTALQNGEAAKLPVFDKAADDRTDMVHQPQGGAQTQILLLEGWCLGIPPQLNEALQDPINSTEADLDPNRTWRTAVNRFLGEEYAALFAELDALLVLQAPSFNTVFDWRWQQEAQLSARFREAYPAEPDPTMTRAQVSDFILHYQRLTEHGLKSLPARADCLWELGADRSVQRMHLTGMAA